MKRLWILIGITVLLLWGQLVPVSAATVTGETFLDCTGFAGNMGIITYDRDNTGIGEEAYDITITDGTGTVIWTLQALGSVGSSQPFTGPFVPYNLPPQANPITLVLTSLAGNGLPSKVILYITGECGGLPPFGCSIQDGRINNLPGKDCAAPVAIYCSEDGIDVYLVNPDTGEGTLALRTSKIDLSIPPADHNQTIASNGNVLLSRLTTGEYQINTIYGKENKPYVFVWDQCPSPTKTYHLAN